MTSIDPEERKTWIDKENKGFEDGTRIERDFGVENKAQIRLKFGEENE